MENTKPQWNMDIPIDLSAPGAGPAGAIVPEQTVEKTKMGNL